MTARGPYYVDKDAWVAQPVGSTAKYGNGAGTLIMLGPAPAATSGDPDFKSRGMFEISAADVTAFMANATSIDSATVTLTVGANTCIGSRGSTTRLFLEEMTADFSENAKTACLLSSTSDADTRWGQSDLATDVNRASFSGSSLSTGDSITFDVTALFEARRVAGDLTSPFRFRVISANSGLTAYDETTSSRRIAVCAREDATTSNRPKLSGNITIGSVAKSLTETGAGTDALSVSQSGTSPVLAESATATDGFTGGPAAGWSTGLDETDNGRAYLYLPTRDVSGYAVLTTVSEQDIELRCKVKLDKVPLGGSATFYLLARAIDKDNAYRARLIAGGNLHDITIVVDKITSGSSLPLQFVTNVRAFLADTDYWLKLSVEGTNPTTLKAKVWRWGDAEPGWVLNVEDSTAALQSAGAVGIGGALSSTVTNAPLTLSTDQLEGYAP